jgi:DNA transformation protein and related proteins
VADDSFLQYVLEQLAGVRPLSVRRMFGGHGLYLDGTFFGIVHTGALYFRTDETSRHVYVRAGARPFNPKGRQELHRYYEVPGEILEDADALCIWAEAAANIVTP